MYFGRMLGVGIAVACVVVMLAGWVVSPNRVVSYGIREFTWLFVCLGLWGAAGALYFGERRSIALVLALLGILPPAGAYLFRGSCESSVLFEQSLAPSYKAVAWADRCGATVADQYRLMLEDAAGFWRRRTLAFSSYERPTPIGVESLGPGRLELTTDGVNGRMRHEIEFDSGSLEPVDPLRFYRGNRVGGRGGDKDGSRSGTIERPEDALGGEPTNSEPTSPRALPAGLPEGAAVDFRAALDYGVSIVSISERLDDPIHEFDPVESDYRSRLFLIRDDRAVEVANDEFRKPGLVWEGLECSPLELSRLGTQALPAVLSQRCDESGESNVVFAVLAPSRLETPVFSSATWMHVDDIAATQETFLYGAEADAAGETVRRRGALTEGVEQRVEEGPMGESKLFQRRYWRVWDGTQLVREQEEWQRVD